MKRKLILLVFLSCATFSNAQVGINTATPNASSVLDLNSHLGGTNYGGFMPPRVTLAQRNLIPVTAAEDGLMVYVSFPTGERCLQLYNGITLSWENINCFSSSSTASTLLISNGYINGQTQYTFSSGDVLYNDATGGTLPNRSTSGVCSGAAYRVQLSSCILNLTNSSASKIIIYGRSSGAATRTLINLETSTTLNGTYTPVTGYDAITPPSTLSNTCGILTVSGIDIPANTYIRFTFDAAINLSGFDIISP